MSDISSFLVVCLLVICWGRECDECGGVKMQRARVDVQRHFFLNLNARMFHNVGKYAQCR